MEDPTLLAGYTQTFSKNAARSVMELTVTFPVNKGHDACTRSAMDAVGGRPFLRPLFIDIAIFGGLPHVGHR